MCRPQPVLGCALPGPWLLLRRRASQPTAFGGGGIAKALGFGTGVKARSRQAKSRSSLAHPINDPKAILPPHTSNSRGKCLVGVKARSRQVKSRSSLAHPINDPKAILPPHTQTHKITLQQGQNIIFICTNPFARKCNYSRVALNLLKTII